MSPLPTVTVVVPVYRAERYVGECMRAIAAQQHQPHEVVLVDDHGGDRSIELACVEAERLGLAVVVERMGRNVGVGAARNAGARRATGDFLWFLDADDSADPRFLAMLAGRAREDGTRIAASRTRRFSAGTPDLTIEPLDGDVVLDGRAAAEALLTNAIRGYACNKLIERSLALAHPFAEGVMYEDLDATLAMVLDAGAISLCAEPLFHYREHAASASRTFSVSTFDLLDQGRRIERILEPDRGLRRLAPRYRCEGVLLPLANMGARAGRRDPEGRRAVRSASSHVRIGDLARLLAARAWRIAGPAVVLKLSPTIYGLVLRRR